MLRFLAILAILGLSACQGGVSIPLSTSDPIYVASGSASERLLPSDVRHAELVRWLEQNRSGWSQMYATNPNGGILVSVGGLRLQFVGKAAFLLTPDGMFTKNIDESEYAFLKSAAGT